jgi:hypothetical protein
VRTRQLHLRERWTTAPGPSVQRYARTRTRYVRQGERASIEAMVASYRRLWALVEELTEVNLQLLNAEPAQTVSR